MVRANANMDELIKYFSLQLQLQLDFNRSNEMNWDLKKWGHDKNMKNISICRNLKYHTHKITIQVLLRHKDFYTKTYFRIHPTQSMPSLLSSLARFTFHSFLNLIPSFVLKPKQNNNTLSKHSSKDHFVQK